ncbi:MAG: hypothetical protein H6579_09175 [Chitinophagales bacterium]|nr:hypothetical protein [Chitinophagales bacterium]
MTKGKDTILLIDDDFSNFIDGLAIAAKGNRLKMEGSSSIANGIEHFRANQNSVGAILLDLSFTPGNYEGVEGLVQIRSTNQLVPVIILTGGNSKNELSKAVECMQKGAYHYFLKGELNIPTLFLTLTKAIQQYDVNEENERHSKLKEEFISKLPTYNKMLNTTEIIISNMLNGEMMLPPTIEGRVKEFKSFYNKLLSKEKKEGKITEPFKRITDIAGFRVIFYNAMDLEKAVEIIKSSKDFLAIDGSSSIVADDKTNTFGYRAVHFDLKINPALRLHLKEYEGIDDIPCEIQFKTIFAHSWSKVHHAFSYKQNGTVALNAETQEMLNEDFNVAAKNLEDIENQITALCKKYADATNNFPNGN